MERAHPARRPQRRRDPARPPRTTRGSIPGYVTQPRDVVAGGEAEAEPDLDPPAVVAYELGLGRAHVLSAYGRDDATTRWYEGDRGPTAPIAQAAPAQCSTCGYLVTLGGPLRSVFGVCANAWSPDDGQVVSYDHGCGAHSEATVETADRALGETVIDTVHFDPIEHRRPGSTTQRR